MNYVGMRQHSRTRSDNKYGKYNNESFGRLIRLLDSSEGEGERKDGVTEIRQPEKNPRGMGIAALLTSDLFELPISLDLQTQSDLNRKRNLMFKKDRSKEEDFELNRLNKSLSDMGFTMTTRDPLYNKFLEKLYSREEFMYEEPTEIEREEMSKLMDEVLDEILAEENK